MEHYKKPTLYLKETFWILDYVCPTLSYMDYCTKAVSQVVFNTTAWLLCFDSVDRKKRYKMNFSTGSRHVHTAVIWIMQNPTSRAGLTSWHHTQHCCDYKSHAALWEGIEQAKLFLKMSCCSIVEVQFLVSYYTDVFIYQCFTHFTTQI